MAWNVTVAAIIERAGRFLVVEEMDQGFPEAVWNQPAGHVDPGEALLDAVVREVREETGLLFTPSSFVGVYQLLSRSGRDYCRFCFAGTVPDGTEARAEDPEEILACHWLTRDEIAAGRPRSSVVLRCIDDYLAGVHLPLWAVTHFHADR